MSDQPVFLLAPPRSFTSVICFMLGEHPELYGLPELNLFVAETMGERAAAHEYRFQDSGLLRAVAQILAGEQSVATVRLAQQWIDQRDQATGASVLHELARRSQPRRLVEKSPSTVLRLERLDRIRRAFPHARYVHLLRHPRSQGESLWKLGGRAAADYLDGIDEGTRPPVPDMQRIWYRMHLNIIAFLARIPADRRMRIRGEEVMAHPDAALTRIADWLGVSTRPSAIAAMKHPERSPFAQPGPPNARLGSDPDFLRSPALRSKPRRQRRPTLDGPLPWRDDGAEFAPEVVELAREFGYS